MFQGSDAGAVPPRGRSSGSSTAGRRRAGPPRRRPARVEAVEGRILLSAATVAAGAANAKGPSPAVLSASAVPWATPPLVGGTAAGVAAVQAVTLHAVTPKAATPKATPPKTGGLKAPAVSPVSPAPPRVAPVGSPAPAAGQPSVVTVTPAAGATGVLRDAFVRASVSVPNGAGVDPATVTSANVFLTGPGGAAVAAAVNTSGGGDVLVLSPTANLAANTTYTFSVTSGVKDLTGVAFAPFTSTFTTGATAGTTSGFRFSKTQQTAAPAGKKYTGVTFGPDGKLYATALTGEIYRFVVGATGTLTLDKTITTISSQNRYLIGLTFDPASTAANPIAWVTHTQAVLSGGADWASKLTKLTGPDLGTAQDAIVGLPRSKKDHLSNQITFGPDGALYFNQGANNAMGGPDSAWGYRLERLLNAATLRVDLTAINARLAGGQGPLNVRTQGPTFSGANGDEADDVAGISAAWSGTPYDPFAAGAPLTIYASGVRNAYDMVWTQTNGQWNLYTSTNGSAPGGTTPATPAPGSGPYLPRVDAAANGGYVPPATQVAQVTNSPLDEADKLYRIRGPVNGVPAGGVPYFGHPNPARNEYILNGGNPTSGRDRNEATPYPVGTQPDRNYDAADAYEYTNGTATDSPSADGIIQYKGAAFSGGLTGRLLIIAYSSAKEIYAAKIGPDGGIVPTNGADIQKAAVFDAATGQSMKFTGGLDLTENAANGNLYVADHDGAAIYLLAPVDPDVAADKTRLVFSDAIAAPGGASQRVVVRNNGTTPLTISGVTLAGTNAANFTIVSAPATGASIPAGGSTFVDVAFTAAGATALSIRTATLNVATNDADTPTLGVSLRGLALNGYQGTNEPPLQTLATLYEVPITVGGTALSLPYTFTSGTPTLLGQESVTQRFVKAGGGPVTVQPLATFGPDATPDYMFGYYAAGTAAAKTPTFTAETPTGDPTGGGGQTAAPVPTATAGAALTPTPDGPATVSFDPGAGAFGLYATFTGVSPTLTAYSEDSLNTAFDATTPVKNRRMRFWPLRDAAGTVVPDAYVGGMEEASNNDLQDVVFVVRNVAIAGVDRTAPRVAGVSVGGTAWAAGAAAYAVPTGSAQTRPLPWSTANQVRVRFDEDVVATAASLSVAGAVGSYAVSNFSYNATTFEATWTLGAAPGNDRLKFALSGVTDAAGNALDGEWTDAASTFPSGNGSAGGAFGFAVNVLPGDTDGDGVVGFVDFNQLLANYGKTGVPLLNGDVDADGVVGFVDFNLLLSGYGRPLTAAPLSPSALAATPTSATTVTLAWTDNATTEVGFRVERSTAGGPFVQVGSPAADATTYADTGLSPSTAYAYRVRAYNNDGASPNSAYSNTATATTPSMAFVATLEAEAATVFTTGATTAAQTRAIPPVLTGDTLNAGYSGAGYVDFGTTAGDYVQWSVTVPAAGSYKLDIQYANGGGTNRPLAFSVNGTVLAAQLAFGATAGWTTWVPLAQTVTLAAGANTVRLAIPTGLATGPNLDFLRVTQL
jgi:hypothetical protein